MKKEKFEQFCKTKGFNAEDVAYNCGHDIEELKLYGGKLYCPCHYVLGKPQYKYNECWEIILEDCV